MNWINTYKYQTFTICFFLGLWLETFRIFQDDSTWQVKRLVALLREGKIRRKFPLRRCVQGQAWKNTIQERKTVVRATPWNGFNTRMPGAKRMRYHFPMILIFSDQVRELVPVTHGSCMQLSFINFCSILQVSLATEHGGFSDCRAFAQSIFDPFHLWNLKSPTWVVVLPAKWPQTSPSLPTPVANLQLHMIHGASLPLHPMSLLWICPQEWICLQTKMIMTATCEISQGTWKKCAAHQTNW